MNNAFISLLVFLFFFRVKSFQLSLLYRARRKFYMQDGSQFALGTVCLVGAGPGDPDLLTIQAVKKLNEASLVVADRLVSPEILSLVKCKLKVANKRPGCAEEAQEEINQWVLEGVRRGERVVRLKIGDPFLFGRGAEEIIEYRKQGIEPVILPGLSSSYAAPLVANIPLTHRGTANQVLISTGYGMNGTHVDLPEYHSERTLVLLMAIGRIEDISKELILKGYPESTPICIVEKATTPQQRILTSYLNKIVEKAKQMEVKPPATIIIGKVVQTLHG